MLILKNHQTKLPMVILLMIEKSMIMVSIIMVIPIEDMDLLFQKSTSRETMFYQDITLPSQEKRQSET